MSHRVNYRNVPWHPECQRIELGVLAAGNFTAPPDFPKNNPSVVMEVFKVQDGMIRHIFAFFRGNGQPNSGWPDVPAK